MSRLDDLKNEKKFLEMEIDALDDRRIGIDYHNTHDASSSWTAEDIDEAYDLLSRDAKQLFSRLREVKKELKEEEKRVAAEKADSLRPQRYPEKERVCSRCGSPLGTHTLCYRCLTL